MKKKDKITLEDGKTLLGLFTFGLQKETVHLVNRRGKIISSAYWGKGKTFYIVPIGRMWVVTEKAPANLQKA